MRLTVVVAGLLAVLFVGSATSAGSAGSHPGLIRASRADRRGMMKAEKVLPGVKPLRAWVWAPRRRLCYRGGEPFMRVAGHRWREGGRHLPRAFVLAYAKACAAAGR